MINSKNSLSIFFTGMRPNKLGSYDWHDRKIQSIMLETRDIILRVVEQENWQNFTFIFGGAIGFDTIAFFVSHRICQLEQLNIRLVLAVPFKKQHLRWNEKDVARYQKMLKLADEVVYVDTLAGYNPENLPVGEYYPEKMQLRNMWMCDQADIGIACWNGTLGGTKNCLDYAKMRGKKVTIFNPDFC